MKMFHQNNNTNKSAMYTTIRKVDLKVFTTDVEGQSITKWGLYM
jgi:hypothetical protein